MKPSSSRLPKRRGVTLVEMLVTIGLLVLVMSILVAIFGSATGAITSQRTYATLDQDLRRIEAQLRLDLEGRNGIGGITPQMTPPNDPEKNKGYFAYGENALADAQGEDTDDYLAFTAQAPQGQLFSGMVVVPTSGIPTAIKPYPITVGSYHRVPMTSDKAEIIYFLRNGNLYRRVFLILEGDVARNPFVGMVGTDNNGVMLQGGGYRTATGQSYGFPNQTEVNRFYGFPASWHALNDISARPSEFPTAIVAPNPYFPSLVDSSSVPLARLNASMTYRPQFNSLGDLTDRQNRAFNPRHARDHLRANTTSPLFADDLPDGDEDDNAFGIDGVQDYYPTLYPGAFTNTNLGGQVYPTIAIGSKPVPPGTVDRFQFPYVYTNDYSKPDPTTFSATVNYGRTHSLDPSLNPSTNASNPAEVQPFYPRIFNHAPVAIGDNLPIPGQYTTTGYTQTWWGFPTKKEMLSTFWTDPVKRLNDPATFPVGSNNPVPMYYATAPKADTFDPDNGGDGLPVRARLQSRGLRPGTALAEAWLPAMNSTRPEGASRIQPYNDGVGSTSFGTDTTGWHALIDEDLILSNVRSFDIKALETLYYEPDPAQTGLPALPPTTRYVDLGYGNMVAGTPVRLSSGIDIDSSGSVDYYVNTLQTFAHEGRMPPLTTDNRSDALFPNVRTNIGDDQLSVVRLRRVWDSWSTTYTQAGKYQDTIDPTQRPPFAPPALVSYPAPYEAPLRGIQIQIRVVDPKNERIKLLTLRHDFSKNL